MKLSIVTIKTDINNILAVILRPANPRLAYAQDRIVELDKDNNVIYQVDALELFSKLKHEANNKADWFTTDVPTPNVFVPHLNKFIEDKQFLIWEDGECINLSFSYALSNWTKPYAQQVLDMNAEYDFSTMIPMDNRASLANNKLLDEAAELVLSKYEYIANNTTI